MTTYTHADTFGTIEGATVIYNENDRANGLVIHVSKELQAAMLAMTGDQLTEFVRINVKTN